MKKTLVRMSLAAVGLLLITGPGQTVAADYAYTVEDKDISFAWKVDGDQLAVKLSARTDGWVGIGFNPSKKMKDANYVLGYVKDGEVVLSDEFGERETAHSPDEEKGGKSDVTLVGGSEEAGVTTIEFTMPLDSGDSFDNVITVDGNTTVQLAYGAGRDSFKGKHKYRTTMVVNLATGSVDKGK
jgi:hypothetical protein